MTTLGDIIRGGVAGAPTRVAVGAEGTVQTVVGGVPAWAAAAGAALSNATPAALGTAAAGVSTEASRADHVHEAPAGGVSIGTAGADAARPAATTDLIGSTYTATDTATRYLCEPDGSGGARWCVAGRHQYEGRDTTCARMGGTRTAASNVSISAGTILSGAMVFSLGTLPSDGRYLLTCNAPATGNGWRLSIGDVSGARGRLMSYRQGMGTAFAELTTAVAAADNAMHCIAWSWNGATVRYSWDGAAVATASHGSGTMSAGTGPIRIGADAFFTAAPDADIAAIKLWSTLVGDADLEAIAAAYATGRIPDVAGSTVVFDWHAARYAEGFASQVCVRGTAQRMTWSAAPPMVIR